MKKLLLMLVPLALFAQVEIDTVIRMPSFIQNGYYVPELNKLYVLGWYEFYVLDCSTYQVKTRIPRPWDMGCGCFSWNSRRQKLYIGVSPLPDSTIVVDAVADTLLSTLPVRGYDHAYSSELDRLYLCSGGTLYTFDCASDTVLHSVRSPVPGYAFHDPKYDSVGRKLYVGLDRNGSALVAVYDCIADSFRAIIDVSEAVISANNMNFDYAHHKAYFLSSVPLGPQHAGVIDIERDSLLKIFHFCVVSEMMNPVAVNTIDEKVYIHSNWWTNSEVETLYVIDPSTDSFVKKCPMPGKGPDNVCWVPWSDRIYTTSDHDRCLRVLDCRTDSYIVPRMQLGYWGAANIQLDPIRQRIFIIGAESTTIHVLRDVGYGVAESPMAGPQLASGMQVLMTSGGYDVRYSVPSASRVDLCVYDLMGREVRQLVAEEQSAGQHSAVWNGTDRSGATVARGVYFVRLETPGFSDVKKAVVTR